ncbi:MAG TPA: hypothetical protein VI357_03945 [Mycobacteriales bacterium]
MTGPRAVLAAAAAALGTELTGGETLGGSDRSLVLRATAGDRPVVLKAPLDSGPGPVRELAALRLLAGVPGVVRLLAESGDPPVLVLEDLGPGPSLADALLGSDPAAAQAALDGWAGTLGAVQAATAGLGAAFAAGLAELSRLGPPPADGSADMLAEAAGALARHLPRLGVHPSPAALDELRALRLEGPGVLTPGDTCPDNTVATPDGYVLFDLEAAEFRHPAWDAAYLRVPWPTCWCAWTLPDAVAEQALARWRAAFGPVPAGFDADLDRATLAWAFVSAGFFLPRILAGADSVRDDRIPLRRTMLQHRFTTAPGTGPLADLATEVATALHQTYGDHPLPLAPAFR